MSQGQFAAFSPLPIVNNSNYHMTIKSSSRDGVQYRIGLKDNFTSSAHYDAEAQQCYHQTGDALNCIRRAAHMAGYGRELHGTRPCGCLPMYGLNVRTNCRQY